VAHRVAWSPAALEDVDSIAAYIARDSAHYAAAVVRQILSTSRQLADFPRSGRVVPEFEDESLRELLVSSYRLIYEVREETVTIAAVVHAKQSFSSGEGRLRDRGA